MPRNLDRRVEAMAPVLDRSLRERLDEILQVELEDDVLAWTLNADGCWKKVETAKGVNAQRILEERALARAYPSDGSSANA
jgi:polyphosphate kinase